MVKIGDFTFPRLPATVVGSEFVSLPYRAGFDLDVILKRQMCGKLSRAGILNHGPGGRYKKVSMGL